MNFDELISRGDIHKRHREDGGFDLTAKLETITRIEKFDMHGNLYSIEMHIPGQAVISTHHRRDVYSTLGPIPRLILSERIEGMHGYSPIRAIIPDPDVLYATPLRRHSPGPDYD